MSFDGEAFCGSMLVITIPSTMVGCAGGFGIGLMSTTFLPAFGLGILTGLTGLVIGTIMSWYIAND